MKRRKLAKVFTIGISCGLALAVMATVLLQGNLQVKVLMVMGATGLLYLGYLLGLLVSEAKLG